MNTGSGAGGAISQGRPGATAKPDVKALLNALMELLREGVASDDADAKVPEAIERMISAGADIAAVTEALRQAMEAGAVSPLLLAKAEKLLGTSDVGARKRLTVIRYCAATGISLRDRREDRRKPKKRRGVPS